MLARLGHSQKTMLQSLLTAGNPLTIDQLGDNLGISKNAIYQHIGALERIGFVEKSNLNRTGGRPSQSYQLSEAGRNLFPKHYALISSLLIDLLKEDLGREKVENYLQKLGDQIGQEYIDKVKDKTPDERVEILSDIMFDLGYEANIIRSTNGGPPEIRVANCVFHSLAQTHTEICSLDLAFMKKISGGEIEHYSSIAKSECCCKFKMLAAEFKAAAE